MWHVHVHSTARKRQGRRLILVVDDDRDTRETLAVLLRMGGHAVRVASNGQEALEAARALHPDVIFLDIGMPIVNGYDVCAELRREPALEHTNIYAISGRSGPEHDQACRNSGFTAQLLKPVEPSALSRLI
jgi:CheY-like chemotaxis protein